MPILQVMDFSGEYEVTPWTRNNKRTGEVRTGFHALVPLQGGKNWKVDTAKLSLMHAARDLLENEHPVTLRRLYYMLFGAGWIDNSQETYSTIIIPCMVEARQRSIIPWDHLTDTTRPPKGVPMWDSPEDFLRDAPGWYKRDVWTDQSVYIEVWVEKRADMAHVMAAAHPYCVTVNAGNGYDGWSSIHDASLRLKEHEAAGRQCHVLYLGDYDPSGLHMAHSLEERLTTFGVSPTFHRLGVNRGDIDEYSLPEWPGKESDSRAKWMVAKHGELIQVEMDALPIDIVKSKVQETIESLLDMNAFKVTQARNEQEVETLREALNAIRISINDEPAPPKKQKAKKAPPSNDWKPGDSGTWD